MGCNWAGGDMDGGKGMGILEGEYQGSLGGRYKGQRKRGEEGGQKESYGWE